MGVEYDDEITKVLENQTWVRVGVTLKVNLTSNYSSSIQNFREREIYIKEIKQKIVNIQDKVLQHGSQSEIKDINKDVKGGEEIEDEE